MSEIPLPTSKQAETLIRINPEPISSKDMVNHPPHYNTGKIEVIDVIEDWKLGFNDGNAVKYIARHSHKSNPIEDLKKAVWYINREIERLTREHNPTLR